jgi:peptidoglycan/xylan/chitin deacetylase (PgdA/CDA1 family)
MGIVRGVLWGIGHLAFGTFAFGLGLAASEFTDIARVDHTRVALASAPRAPRKREAAPTRAGPVKAPTHVELVPTSAAPTAALAEPTPAPAAEPASDDASALAAPRAREPMFDGLGESMRDGRVMRGATPHKLILFTFDDGPDRNTTPILLDRLDAAGVRAVFFLTGDNLRGENVAERKNQEIARETVRRGHLVASHGMHHRQLPLLSDYQALLEVGQTELMFKRVLGARPWLIRPPGGARSARIDRLLSERGYTTVLWNLGAGDFQVRTAADVHKTWQAVFERRRNHGENGGIVLLHDTYAWSVDAFQLIVQDLLDQNCKLLAKNEELYDFVDDPAIFFQARNGADASLEAEPVVLAPAVLEARQARIREETAQRCQALAFK